MFEMKKTTVVVDGQTHTVDQKIFGNLDNELDNTMNEAYFLRPKAYTIFNREQHEKWLGEQGDDMGIAKLKFGGLSF